MKELKYCKKIKQEVGTFSELIDSYCLKMNQEFAKRMNQLVEDIAAGENLDPKMLKSKYIKSQSSKSISTISEETPEELNSEEFNGELLEVIKINNITYYYEKKALGNVYNNSSKIVGVYKDNKVILNEE